MWNGFFSLESIKDLETLKQLYLDALEVSKNTNVDILRSFKRERWGEETPEEYIEKYITLDAHNVVIDRQAYYEALNHGEIASGGYNENKQPIYLFMELELEDFYNLVDKYKLQKREF